MERKKVKMNLSGLNHNAFVILGRFSKEAKRQGWEDAEIKAVVDEAKSGDYDHLLRTMLDNTEEPEDSADD